jgi:hypothetical protein
MQAYITKFTHKQISLFLAIIGYHKNKKNYLVILKEFKPGCNRVICKPTFIAALFTMSKLWKQLRSPTTDDYIKRIQYVYTMEYCSVIT